MAGSVYVHHRADTWQQCSNRLRRHSFYGRRDVLSTSLALNGDMYRSFWSREHRNQHRRTKSKNHLQLLDVETDRFPRIERVQIHAYAGYPTQSTTHNGGISHA